ncbi:MAG TPA: flagellar basal body-associated FliL family protein [Bacillota bacterium]|nr:flagellar basal body-associated FliL family protein [Bacillota bacterium]
MKKKLLPIIIVLVAVLIFLGVAWYFLHRSTTKEQPVELNADAILETMVDTEPLTTNLKTDGFIQLRFQMQTNSKKAKEELAKRNFQVRNIALRLASSMTAEEVQNPDGMAKLEDQLKKQVNLLMQNGQVEKVFITNKIIQ